METILSYAQGLVYTLVNLMPSSYQQQSLQALLGLFLEAQGHPLPQSSLHKSASALSRFLNRYHWSTRSVIRATRQAILQQLQSHRPVGRKPRLTVLIDLTTAEKVGKFQGIKARTDATARVTPALGQPLDQLIRVYNGKRGLHLVILYLVVGQWRLPWGFRVYRGKGHATPVQLGLKLLGTLPKSLRSSYDILVMADTGFGSIGWINGVRALGFAVFVGVAADRRLADGRAIATLTKRGTQVTFEHIPLPLTLSWFWLKRNGKWEQRFIVSSLLLSGAYLAQLGKQRWQIEAFFKTAKHRFGLHRFGQATRLGVYRWIILCLIAFLLAHWAHLWSGQTELIDWGQAALLAQQTLLPLLLLQQLFRLVDSYRPIARQYGFSITVRRRSTSTLLD